MESNNPTEQSVITKAGWLNNRRHFLMGGGVSIAAAAMNSLFAADNARRKRHLTFQRKRNELYTCAKVVLLRKSTSMTTSQS